jgi:hypothetical protein
VSSVALISDLHSNREALESVLQRIGELGVPEICCLGDVIGYGADPEPCVGLVMERCKWTIMGNHDWGLVNDLGDFNPLAREALAFTRKKLRPNVLAPRKKAMWSFLLQLPDRMADHGNLYFHGSPRDPIMEYVLKSDGFLEPEKMAEIFRLIDRPCFVGHTHWPGVHRLDFRFSPATDDHREVTLNGEPAVINVGSVGQPRDGDSRACSRLHPALAERLARGK